MLRTRTSLGQKRLGRVAIGVLGVLVAIGYTYEAFKIPFGRFEQPGPGMYPRGVGLAAIAISIILILEALLTDAVSGEVDFPTGHQRRLVVAFGAATMGLVVVLPLLGQYVASAIYVIVMLKLLSTLSWPRVVVYGLLTSVVVTGFFAEVLMIPLPRGFW